jgi:predicted metal-dependent hydrolase
VVAIEAASMELTRLQQSLAKLEEEVLASIHKKASSRLVQTKYVEEFFASGEAMMAAEQIMHLRKETASLERGFPQLKKKALERVSEKFAETISAQQQRVATIEAEVDSLDNVFAQCRPLHSPPRWSDSLVLPINLPR